jgi:stage II sporulation protein D
MSKLFTTFFILAISSILTAQEISVAIYYEKNLQGLTLTVQKGLYLIYDDIRLVDTLYPGNNISIVKESEFLVYRDRAIAWATDKDIRLVGGGDASFFINYSGSDEPARCYDGWLRIKVRRNDILAINNVTVDSYVAAVVEGKGADIAKAGSYKSQVVIYRTFAMLNYGRHSSEGFDLCDCDHCQVYKNKARNRDIIKISKRTSKMGLVDNSINLLNPLSSLSSAECLKQPSEYVWDNPEKHQMANLDTVAVKDVYYSWNGIQEVLLKQCIDYYSIASVDTFNAAYDNSHASTDTVYSPEVNYNWDEVQILFKQQCLNYYSLFFEEKNMYLWQINE